MKIWSFFILTCSFFSSFSFQHSPTKSSNILSWNLETVRQVSSNLVIFLFDSKQTESLEALKILETVAEKMKFEPIQFVKIDNQRKENKLEESGFTKFPIIFVKTPEEDACNYFFFQTFKCLI